jgi:hypothetical protein
MNKQVITLSQQWRVEGKLQEMVGSRTLSSSANKVDKKE